MKYGNEYFGSNRYVEVSLWNSSNQSCNLHTKDSRKMASQVHLHTCIRFLVTAADFSEEILCMQSMLSVSAWALISEI